MNGYPLFSVYILLSAERFSACFLSPGGMEEAVKARSKTPALGRVLCGLSTAAFLFRAGSGAATALLHPAGTSVCGKAETIQILY